MGTKSKTAENIVPKKDGKALMAQKKAEREAAQANGTLTFSFTAPIAPRHAKQLSTNGLLLMAGKASRNRLKLLSK